ncbi:MAG: GNAT family N-acetyltransferase [Maricaulaceae bacterium]|jgi:ribosomal protein S18 acetylase RimI-like enzyme
MTDVKDISIRDARLDDAPVLAALMTELGYPTEPVDMSAGLNNVLANPAFRTIVAEIDDGVVGFGGFRVGPTFEGDVLEGEIVALIVDPGYRSQGVGAAIVAEGEAWVIERGASSMMLGTRGDRKRAHTFYRREGYVEDGMRYRKNLDPGGPIGGAA